MITIKKSRWTIVIILAFWGVFNQTALVHAQAGLCNTFDFPSLQKNNLYFFNCNTGEVEKFDTQNSLTAIPAQNNLGGSVSAFIWSPDGKKALVLSANISAAMQNMEFYSPDRGIDSLNWWLYDLTTGQATLLDKNILSAGWASDTTIVYNSDNAAFYTTGANFESPVKLADIGQDSDNLNDIVAPVNLGGITVFPMEKGFYSINVGQKSATYYSLPDGIQKILADPFQADYFIIQSGNTLYKFTISNQQLSAIDNNFSANDLAFLNQGVLVIVGRDGKVYSYNINSKVKSLIPLKASGVVYRVFSLVSPESFVFTIGQAIYRGNSSGTTTLLSKDGNAPDNTGQSTGNNTRTQTQTKTIPTGALSVNPTGPTSTQTSSTPANNSGLTTLIILLVVALIILIAGVIIYKKLNKSENKNDENKNKL